jgi:non-lysosomal glucosylceramidase
MLLADSIHNDGERHIPYIMFMTNGTRSKMAAWAGNEFTDGMLAEQVGDTNEISHRHPFEVEISSDRLWRCIRRC